MFSQGESRLLRMQFDGRNRAEAVKECSSAVEKLREYLSVSNQDDAPLPANQPPTDVCAPVTQVIQFPFQHIQFLFNQCRWTDQMVVLFQFVAQRRSKNILKWLLPNLWTCYGQCRPPTVMIQPSLDGAIYNAVIGKGDFTARVDGP